MSTEVTYPHILKQEGQPARLKQTPRIRVAQIAMDYLNYGWSVDEMCRQHPYLSLGEAHAAMAYYFDHQDEIDAEIEAEWKEAESALMKVQSSRLRLRLKSKGLL